MAKRPDRPVPTIACEGLELGRALKLAGLADSGGEAKHLVQAGLVRIDGRVETRRGHRLVAGDLVESRGRSFRVAAAPPA